MKEDAFPTYTKPKLTQDEVINYLLSLRTEGHDVYKDEGRDILFFIVLNDLYKIRISYNVDNCSSQIQLLFCENMKKFVDVKSLAQLEKTVSAFARQVPGSTWPKKQESGRLSKNTPATNFKTISELIEGSNIEAIFDPYLDNNSLTTIIDILSFGNSEVSEGVRLLGSTKKSKGTMPKFTNNGVEAWLTQLNVKGEARVMDDSDEHRRFILLTGNKSLLLGHSLNAIHKNEAIRIESDTEDKKFFDQVWTNSKPL